ncbi:MAG: hypothetical protein QG602_1167 [Verrucomicrobiota bacterium]|nr:hypothetical protein [Verrucomicrobiota bacterium]
MDDTKPANEPNQPGLNKIDLSQLQSFNFGTQWTEVKPVAPGRRERDFDRDDRGERRDRRDRRDGGGGGGPGPAGGPPRDRRGFRKPAGAPAGAPGAAPSGPAGEGGGRPQGGPGGEHRRFERGPGGPRRDFRGGDRREAGDRRDGGGQSFERAPYVSPFFTATCYPEDTGFAAIVKAVRASCRTFQLFEITKAVLEKNDRFVMVIQRTKPAATEGQPATKPAPLYMSMPDHLPFDTEDAAIQHALSNNLGAFFEMQEVEVEAPKGSFPIINKCGITGELLGPPNYHRYQQFLQQHYAAKIKGMSFDRFRENIVSAREPEVVAAWQEKMKKATRYTWKPPVARSSTKPPMEAPAATETVAPAAVPVETPAESAPVETPATPVEATPVAPALTFDSLEEARLHLLTQARERMVRTVETVRFHGKNIEKLPPGEIRRALEGHIERQRRFPLDTANALRGRLRREGFTIFKKGSRGVSYVCAVKRRFRVPGQVFSESIGSLIDFIERHPMVHVKDLPKVFLGIEIPAAPAAPVAPAEGATASQSPFAALPPEQSEKLRKMSNDLRWLVMEGYVTEFSDGKLFAPPVMAPQAAKKAESGEEEHDPVDFPEAHPAVAASPVAETAAPAEEAVTEPAPLAEPAPAAAPVATESAPVPVEEPKPEAPPS